MDMDVINAADSADLLGPRGGAKTLNAKKEIDTIFKQHADASEKGEKEGDDTENTAKGIAERMGEAQDDDNSVGRHTGFLGIPYKNLEDTSPGGEDDDEQEDGGVGDEDDKLTWASWLGGASDGQEESSDGDGQEEGSSGDDEGSEEEDSSGDEDDDDGITWFWEDDDDDDDQGDGQNRPTEDSRDSDPRRSGSGPDPRQGGVGRPGGDSKIDPTPYRCAIVQGCNSDPSDPDSGRSGSGVRP